MWWIVFEVILKLMSFLMGFDWWIRFFSELGVLMVDVCFMFMGMFVCEMCLNGGGVNMKK